MERERAVVIVPPEIVMETDRPPAYFLWGADLQARGPLDLPAVVNEARQGRLAAGVWVYRDDAQVWRRATDWPELKPVLGPRVPPTPTSGLSPAHLRRIKIFTGLDHEQLTSLIPHLEVVEVRQFSTVFRKGDPGDGMYSVLAGEVRAREIAHGQERTLFTLTVGDSFGELALLIEGERATDVVANTDARLVKLPAPAFARIVQEEPALATPLLLAICRTLAHRALVLGQRVVMDRTLAQFANNISV